MISKYKKHLLFLWVAVCGSGQVALSPPPPVSSKVVVEREKITFDPKTCTQGRGRFDWGHGSCQVKILGHQDDHCVFEYTSEIEMGHAVYLVRVPIESGPVTIEEGTITEGVTSYTGIITSFQLDKALLLRQGGVHNNWEVRVGDTDAFVKIGPAERRSEMEARDGDTVKLRCSLFTSSKFEQRMPNVAYDRTVEFVTGDDEGWGWLEIALENLTVGDNRRVQVPMKVAEGARDWVPNSKGVEMLYVEVRLVSIERAQTSSSAPLNSPVGR